MNPMTDSNTKHKGTKIISIGKKETKGEGVILMGAMKDTTF